MTDTCVREPLLGTRSAPIVILTVDTEEEFDWSAPMSSDNRSVTHMQELPRFQDLCDRVGAKPTYVIDHPIAATDSSIAILSPWLREGRCEIGAHIHPWVNPPVTETLSPRNTYLSNLPLELQEAKLRTITQAIRDAFGRNPVSFKAGRYALDPRLIPILLSLGYRADGSIHAYTDFRSYDGGPDHRAYDSEPFWFRLRDATSDADAASRLLEVPCTVGFTRHPWRFWSRIHQRLENPRYHRLHPIGILWHSRIMRKISLTPEGTDPQDLLRLLRAVGRQNLSGRVLQFRLHSPSVAVGFSPYARTAEERDQLLQSLESALIYARDHLGARFLTLGEFRTLCDTSSSVS